MSTEPPGRAAAGAEMARWSAKALLITAGVLLVGGAVWYARAATVPLIVAALIATQLLPLIEIATRRYAGKQRKTDTYQIILQADGSIPYSTIVSTMAAMRCALPEVGKEVASCALPTEDAELKKAPDPISPDKKLYDTARAVYDPKKMALFHEIAFSSGFE